MSAYQIVCAASEYQVVHADNSTDLSELVAALMADGWLLQGGVSVSAERDADGVLGFHYHQAMTR